MKQPSSLTEQLRSILTHPAVDVVIEAKLARSGRLADLEAAGVIPVVQSPNPFNPTLQTGKHDQWWRDHTKEARQFLNELRQREEALKRVYIGTQLTQNR